MVLGAFEEQLREAVVLAVFLPLVISCGGNSGSQASALVTPESTRDSVVCGPDPKAHVDAFAPYVDAGFDEIYVANMGPHYADMLRMYGERVLPGLRG